MDADSSAEQEQARLQATIRNSNTSEARYGGNDAGEEGAAELGAPRRILFAAYYTAPWQSGSRMIPSPGEEEESSGVVASEDGRQGNCIPLERD